MMRLSSWLQRKLIPVQKLIQKTGKIRRQINQLLERHRSFKVSLRSVDPSPSFRVPTLRSLLQVSRFICFGTTQEANLHITSTSVVFGIFGFGATELFRRSFSAIFFDEDAGGSEFVLLAAAGLATLLTCAAGAPFEILRVRSMSNVEAKGVKEVFFDLVVSPHLSIVLLFAEIVADTFATIGTE